MHSARVVSVNVGRPRVVEGLDVTSAIDKHVVASAQVGPLGLGSDEVADTKYHGGAYQAVYAYAQEDLDLWSGRLGSTVRPGLFGENLTTAGIDVSEALVGERWRIGPTLLEVTAVRIPCWTFQQWMAVNGFPARGWVKRFAAEGRPGAYLRVLEPGSLRTGDPVVVEHRPGHGVSVALMFRALTTERSLLPLLLDLGDIDPMALREAAAYVAKSSPAPASV
ncbi:MOSC domain-containing protein [Nocardioides mesophilus]|uniref:MOSC domain-containing protein n=1 Tax=Nocardioides mesophilus TaxID=433659 RepID=A0A7G9RCM9_9ACTN|nr:MOSC domain-containing protein [Nocardioides mesophilus]QNN53354.1 MOSC domain-containing protein [Nocardioides mesophilus]